MKLDDKDRLEIAILNALDNEALRDDLSSDVDERQAQIYQGVYDNYRVYAEQYGFDVQEFKVAVLNQGRGLIVS